MRLAAEPRLRTLVHRLWWDRRLLGSPLLALGPAVVAGGMAVSRFFTGVHLVLASQASVLLTLLVVTWAWRRAVGVGLPRDWYLTGRPAAPLAHALFQPPWFVWWASLCALVSLEYSPPDPPAPTFLRQSDSVAIFLHVPGTPAMAIVTRAGEEMWQTWSWSVQLALLPALLALWAWTMRWVSEAGYCRLHHPVVALGVTLAALLTLRLGLRWGVAWVAYWTTLALQGCWPHEWSLAARLYAGLMAGWLALPVSLAAAGLAARQLAKRLRRQWWATIE